MATRQPRRITQRSIAEALGIRQATVSRVFAGSPLVSADTRRRVQTMADRLGYRPDLAATRLNGDGAYGAMAYAWSTHRSFNLLNTEVLQAVEEELGRRGQHCVLTSFDHKQLEDVDFARGLLRRLMVDALLLGWSAELPLTAVRCLARMRVPAIRVNAPGDSDCVRFDDRGAAAEAARRFAALGHRRLAFINLDVGTSLDQQFFHYSGSERWRGFAEAAQAAGCTAEHICHELPPHEGERLAAMAAFLRRTPRPTGVLCYGYANSALPLAVAALAAGVRLPADLSLMTFSARQEQLANPPMSILRLDYQALGAAAVDLACQRVDGHPALPSVAIPVPYVEGATVGPPAVE